MTMYERILRHLQDYGSITALEAVREYGCMRLSHQIYVLRKKEKYDITSKTEKSVNRYGEPVHYSRYYLN